MIKIVTGPPCSGKSTYIQNNQKPNDVIIDMDRIALALCPDGTKPFQYSQKVRYIAMMARKAAVQEALKQAQGEGRVTFWIIHTDPSPEQRQVYRAAGARFVEMDPGKAECLRRLKNRPPENQTIARLVIDEYYSKR